MDALLDDDLMQMFRDGDTDAFDVLFDRHHRSVYNFATSILHDFGGAEEIMQDSFLAVIRAASSYRPEGHFKTWLMRIVRNRCLNRLASERRRRAAFQQSGLEFVDPVSPRPSPATQASRHDRQQQLRREIAALPDRQREALTLYAFEEMSYREIAEVLDAPRNTVKTWIYQARAGLARSLSEKGVAS